MLPQGALQAVLEALTAARDYIRNAEIAMDAVWGSGRSLEGMIADGDVAPALTLVEAAIEVVGEVPALGWDHPTLSFDKH
ncbi:hypothetical protein LGR54_24790 [Ancylobacter sp. Lp-2]|uniref:hypothetical protein n=1 Tax=Ancylobacter sp. Lp-2 TaxID=2881339 RepID=UPI001E584536|nr:hypothetical protein [Ancylobacter sp. Lp-2]MCB4771832.1 hypothetical protein [Ancylobacter sp. Lp-2]